jgi:hypothetical protein
MMHTPTRRRYDAHRTSRLSSGFRRAILNRRGSDVRSVAINAASASDQPRPGPQTTWRLHASNAGPTPAYLASMTQVTTTAKKIDEPRGARDSAAR